MTLARVVPVASRIRRPFSKEDECRIFDVPDPGVQHRAVERLVEVEHVGASIGGRGGRSRGNGVEPVAVVVVVGGDRIREREPDQRAVGESVHDAEGFRPRLVARVVARHAYPVVAGRGVGEIGGAQGRGNLMTAEEWLGGKVLHRDLAAGGVGFVPPWDGEHAAGPTGCAAGSSGSACASRVVSTAAPVRAEVELIQAGDRICTLQGQAARQATGTRRTVRAYHCPTASCRRLRRRGGGRGRALRVGGGRAIGRRRTRPRPGFGGFRP